MTTDDFEVRYKEAVAKNQAVVERLRQEEGRTDHPCPNYRTYRTRPPLTELETQMRKDEIRRQRNEGRTWTQIGEALGLSEAAVRHWAYKHGLAGNG